MATEANIRAEISKALRAAGFHVTAVENGMTEPGTPDIAWTHGPHSGWIECKWLAAWPKRDAVVLVPKFTPQQRVWLKAHARAGGTNHVAILIGGDRLLLPGTWSAAHLGRVTQSAMRSAALSIWDGPKECSLLLPRALCP